MKHLKLSKKRLALCISAIIAAGFNSSVSAEETEIKKTEETEVITITGIRGSLIRAMDLKREASGVTDVISSEEMGKFPDTNLAEALQRITGVSVSRSNGEGSQITVRGFGPSFNLMTLNGRQMPGNGTSRSYSLENLSSDGVSAISVHKSARAENISGGLGATVDIVTLKPFESPGEKFSLSGKLLNDTSNVEGNDVTPELSVLYSNTFADDMLGFSIGVNYHRRDFQQQRAQIRGWNLMEAPVRDNVIDARPRDGEGNLIGADVAFFPRNLQYNKTDVERERINTSATLQYAPNDDLVVTLDYVGTDATNGTNSVTMGQWHDFGGNIGAYELDEDGTAVWAEFLRNDSSTTFTRSTNRVSARSYGLNLTWHATSNLSFDFDYHDSDNQIDNTGDPATRSQLIMSMGSNQLQTKYYDYRTGEIPQYEVLWNNGTNVLAPEDIDSNYSKYNYFDQNTNIKQLQLVGDWESSFDIPLVNVEFGLVRTEQTMSGESAQTNNTMSAGFDPSYSHVYPDGMFTRVDLDGFLDQFEGGGNDLRTSYYYDVDFNELAARNAAFFNEALLGDKAFSIRGAYGPEAMERYSEKSLEEVTTSIYVQSAWEFDIADLPVSVNVGLRYEETEVTTTSFQPIATSMWWKGNAGSNDWHTQFSASEGFDEREGDYDVLLPMLDLAVDLSDDLVARMSFGKSISRANPGALMGGVAIGSTTSVGSRKASGGNPNLLPYESVNFDLSLEYYYAEGSYASVGYFKKDVENFINNDITTGVTLNGIQDIAEGARWAQAVADLGGGDQAFGDIYDQMIVNGAVADENGYLKPAADDPLALYALNSIVNIPDEKMVEGIEVAVQHLFGETGFGASVNATFVDGDVKYDVDLLEKQSPLKGLSDSANFRIFYEKDELSVNVVYAWRDDYLSATGQEGGSSESPPQFRKDYGQLDLSVNYDLSEELTVSFNAVNLTEEPEVTYGRYERQFMGANQYGVRYVLGARYSF